MRQPEQVVRDFVQQWLKRPTRIFKRQSSLIVSSLYFYVGTEYHQHGALFETATFALRANARWVRFEIVDDRGRKAWSNPFDLTALERA